MTKFGKGLVFLLNIRSKDEESGIFRYFVYTIYLLEQQITFPNQHDFYHY